MKLKQAGKKTVPSSKPTPVFDWNDISALLSYEVPPPNAKTATDYAAQINKKRAWAATILNAAVDKGVLQSKKYVVNGSLTRYYWPSEGK